MNMHLSRMKYIFIILITVNNRIKKKTNYRNFKNYWGEHDT